MPDQQEEKVPHVCLDVVLPPHLEVEAADRAVEENPSNLPVFRHRPGMGAGPLPLAVLTGKKWQNGRTLHVRFLGGTPQVQAKVKQFAMQWPQHANIKLEFDNSPNAEIRIAFEPDGSWSYIGTDNLVIPKNEPTMNFGWFGPGTADEEFERTVVHEFGHALGCIHEHQHPDAGIPWDKEAVFRYYQGPPNNWTRAQVETNLFQRYGATQTQFSKFDTKSIMLYPVDNALTLGNFEIGWNKKLSDTDKEFIGVCYPFDKDKKGGQEGQELKVGSTVSASIGKHGEEDLYSVKIDKAGNYRFETEGSTDVIMSLVGPNDQKKLVAEDDDSGQGRNALITAALQPGQYWLRVRHFKPTGTGSYKLSAKKS
ncbi:MAG TPA: M12 family metallopeptidase [Thermoanaerobaculia bacterium]|nr:M12 family metallopeptidase [Thermoanaerobaculia bacterium]